MNKVIKKIIVCGLIGACLFSTSVFAQPQLIDENVTREYLAKGIVHEEITRFTNVGWMHLNVVRLDIRNADFELLGLVGNAGISGRSAVTDMMTDNGVVAAVNGDFFGYQPVPFSLGGMINGGELIVNPDMDANPKPMFYMTRDKSFAASPLGATISVKNETTGKVFPVATYNRTNSNHATLSLNDRVYSLKSLGKMKYNDMVEVLVVNNMVADVRVNAEAIDIPEGGCVLSQRGEALKSFAVGQTVSIEKTLSAPVADIEFGIGTGSIILQNGNVVNTHIDIKGDHPRTAIGVNADNSELIMLTVDQVSGYKGVNQQALAEIMKDLGAYLAVNMDGGGSTTMGVRSNGTVKLANLPSSSTQRKVVNGVGIKSNATVGAVTDLSLSASSQKVLAGSSVQLKLTGYDADKNVVSINPTDVSYFVDGVQGTVVNGVFTPTTKGTALIMASAYGISTITPVEVLSDVYELSFIHDKMNLAKGAEYTFAKFTAKDYAGDAVSVSGKDVSYEVIGNIGTINGNKFVAANTEASGAIVVRKGNAVLSIPVSIGTTAKLENDFEGVNTESSSAWPADIARASVRMVNEAKSGANSLGLGYDFTKSAATRAAYLQLNAQSGGMCLDENAKSIGLWVKSDGKGAWLRAELVDASGVSKVVDLSKSLTEKGWIQVKAEIPAELVRPVKLKTIYVAETNKEKSYSGTLLIDGLTSNIPTPFGNVNAPAGTKAVDARRVESIAAPQVQFTINPVGLDKTAGYDASAKLVERTNAVGRVVNLNRMDEAWFNRLGARAAYGEAKYAEVVEGNTVIAIVEADRNGARAKDYTQLLKLKSLLANTDKSNIIVVLQTDLFGKNGFKDKEEAQLIHTWLSSAASSGKSVAVVQKSDATSSEVLDKVSYIKLWTGPVYTPEAMNSVRIINFVDDGTGLKYSIEKIFE